jgi:phage gp29-like protein
MALPNYLASEFATLEKSFLTFSGLLNSTIIRNNDPTLLTRGGAKGLALFEEVERDPHAYAVLQKRKRALISRDWQLAAASDKRADRKVRDMVEAQLMNLGCVDYPLAREWGCQGFDGVCLNLLDAIGKGYAAGEVMWAMDGGEYVAAEVRHKDQRRFGFLPTDKGHELRLLTRYDWTKGQDIPPRKIVLHTFNQTDEKPYGQGIDSILFWPVFFKKQDIKFWLIFADKFGSPTPQGKYPVGSKTEDINILLEALESITQGMAAAIPEGMIVEFLEASRSGSINTYEGLVRYMDEQMSEAVLGETGTTNQSGGGGSRARDEVGNEVRLEITKADADLLANTLNNTLIKWISQLNAPEAKPPKLKWVFEKPEDLKSRAERDKTLFDMGYRLRLDAVNEIYGEGYESSQGEASPENETTDAQVAEPIATPAQDVQATALNGAQISSLVEVVTAVSEKRLPVESAIPLLQVALPMVDEARAREILQPAANFQQAVNLSDPLPALAADPEEAAFAEEQSPLFDETQQELRDQLGPVVDGWVDQVRQRLEQSNDLVEFAEGLFELYPELAVDQFANTFRDGLLAVHLGGAVEVVEEGDANR